MGCGSSKDKKKDEDKDDSDKDESGDESEREDESEKEEEQKEEEERARTRHGDDYEETSYNYNEKDESKPPKEEGSLPRSYQPAYQRSYRKPQPPRVVGGKKAKGKPPQKYSSITKDFTKDHYQTWKHEYRGNPDFEYY